MGGRTMNDKERLQQIIDSSVISPCEEKVTISKEGFDWLVERAEKVEQLQKQLERKERALEEMFQNRERWRISHGELEAKLEQQHHEIEQLKDDLRFRLKMLQKQEKDLMNVCEERDKLKQQFQQVREIISETLELLKRGGPGTRSQVQALLEKVLKETQE
jgi:septal ring factor EnvC (AmiA/AmiB activator)